MEKKWRGQAGRWVVREIQAGVDVAQKIIDRDRCLLVEERDVDVAQHRR